MPTIAREIDALGGVSHGSDGSDEYNSGFDDGYTCALEDAQPIAENADALVEELLELIEDMLNGNRRLETWTADARRIVTSVKHRRAQ